MANLSEHAPDKITVPTEELHAYETALVAFLSAVHVIAAQLEQEGHRLTASLKAELHSVLRSANIPLFSVPEGWLAARPHTSLTSGFAVRIPFRDLLFHCGKRYPEVNTIERSGTAPRILRLFRRFCKDLRRGPRC
jgi:hypothetical protein